MLRSSSLCEESSDELTMHTSGAASDWQVGWLILTVSAWSVEGQRLSTDMRYVREKPSIGKCCCARETLRGVTTVETLNIGRRSVIEKALGNVTTVETLNCYRDTGYRDAWLLQKHWVSGSWKVIDTPHIGSGLSCVPFVRVAVIFVNASRRIRNYH